jgi:hypothetical protein
VREDHRVDQPKAGGNARGQERRNARQDVGGKENRADRVDVGRKTQSASGWGHSQISQQNQHCSMSLWCVVEAICLRYTSIWPEMQCKDHSISKVRGPGGLAFPLLVPNLLRSGF